MGYADRIVKGASIVFMLSILGTGMGYLLRIFIARSLPVDDFGLFYSILTFFSLFFVIKDFGLGSALVKYIPEFMVKGAYGSIWKSIKSSFFLQLAIGAALGLLMFAMSDYIAASFFHSQKASLLIKLFSVELVLAVSFLKMLLQGFQKILAFSAIESVRIVLIFFFILTTGDPTLMSVAVSYFAASMAIQIMMALYVTRHVRGLGNGKTLQGSQKKVMIFGSFVFLGSISTFFIGSADTMVLTYFRSLYEVGLYQAAMSTSQLLLVFASSISVILFPVVSEMWAKGRRNELTTHVEFMIKFVFLFVAFAAVIFIAFPEIIMDLFLSRKYIDSALPLQVLSFGMIFFSMNVLFSVILNAIGRPKKSTFTMIAVSIFNVAANIILVPMFGIAGAVVSALSSYAIGSVIFYSHLRKEIKISVPVRDVLMILLNSLISVAIIYFVKQALSMNILKEAAICAVLAGMFYSLIFLKVKIFTKNDMKIIRSSFPESIAGIAQRFSS